MPDAAGLELYETDAPGVAAVVAGAPLQPCAGCGTPVIFAKTYRSHGVFEELTRVGLPRSAVFLLFRTEDGWLAVSLARGWATAGAFEAKVRSLFTPHRCA